MYIDKSISNDSSVGMPNSEAQSHGSPLRPPPQFETPPPNYVDGEGRWDESQGNNFETPPRNNPFSNRGSASEPPKRANPFADKPNQQELIHLQQLQQQQQCILMQQQRLDMSRRNSNPGPGRPFFAAGPPGPGVEVDPFMMNGPRGPPPFVQQQLNFRGPHRNNAPYFRNQKGAGGGPPGNMRGGFRPNFRGRNW